MSELVTCQCHPLASQGAGAASIPSGPFVPNDEALASLLAMGFEPERAAAALQHSNNDLQGAIAMLL